MMERILIVTTGLAIGGAEMQVMALARRYHRDGKTVEIASLLTPVAFIEELKELGIPVHNLKMRRKVPNPMAIVKLVRVYRDFNPEVVHGHMIHANILARVANAFRKVPVLVSTVHSSNEGGKMRMLLYRFTDRWGDYTSCICTPAYQRMVRDKAARTEKLGLVYNAIEPSEFTFDPKVREEYRKQLGVQDKFVWLAVGRFATVKDYPNLIRGFAQHLAQFPDSVLIFAGDGEERGTIESTIQEVGLENSVMLLGMRKDTRELYCAADGVAMSSIFEGLSISLLEAASIGTPIMATAVGGNPEVVGETYPKELQPASGDLPGIANALNYLRQKSSDERASLSEGLRQRVRDHFSVDRIVQQWYDLYETIKKGKA